jgi:long-chain acyl-CoA synthetase
MIAPAHNLATLLQRTAQRWPRLPAVAVGVCVLHDYATLARRAASLASSMREGGLTPGDRVALVARNCAGYVETLFACWAAGLVAVPVNAKLHPRELDYVIEDSEARWVFVDDAWAAALAGTSLERAVVFGGSEYEALVSRSAALAPSAVAADDPAWLFYTSGTTGRPKGVEITHGNLAAMAQCFLSDVEAIAPGDALLHPAPMSHGSGLYIVPHVARGAVSVVPESGGFEPGEIASLVAAWDRCLFFAAPTMVKRLVESPACLDLAHLKCIVYGGGPMYAADCKAAYAALGPRLAQIYGQGESPMTITAMDRALLADAIARGDDALIASVGSAQTGIDVRVAGQDDESLPAGEIGEVLVRGPTVMRGYWRNAEATRRTLCNGWLHTGDVGVMSDDGFLTLKDRSKDLIISGGSNIYPREVEEVLQRHPDVAEVAVVGRAHPDWGEEVVACVVTRGGSAGKDLEPALDALCLSEIARFKRPKAYVFLDALPKNNTGKVLKTVLREQLATKG